MKIISRYTHGLLDYPVGILLLFLPEIVGFSAVGGALVWLPRIIGLLVLLQALFTNYELGVIKVIPMQTHLYADYLLGAILAVSPWLFNLQKYPVRDWVPIIALGVFVLVTSALTDPRPVHRRVTAGM